MFGLPDEVITLTASTAISFYMKYKAQAAADATAVLKMAIDKGKADSALADAAASRGSPWLRKFVGTVIISVTFGGLILAALTDIPVNVIKDVPKSEFLFGLIKWGKTYDIITVKGLVFPEYVRHCTLAVVGYLFGSGFGKTK